MKAGKKGRQSDHQKAWQAEAERAGNKYVVARSFEEFIEAIRAYLDE